MSRQEYMKAYNKKYKLKNKDKISLYNKKYELDYKDRRRVVDNKRLYNITPKQLEVMYEEQDNSCKICNTHKDDTKMGLVIDHCHKTLEVRGLLCHNCNVALGHLKDDTELLDKAKQYLKTNGKFN